MKARLLLPLATLLLVAAGVLAWAQQVGEPLAPDAKADLVVVEKSRRTLTLIYQGKPLKTYRVSLGKQPVGRKTQEGDRRTPEGRYIIDFHKGDSSHFLALHISYPNRSDREAAKAMGLDPGSAVEIHGIRPGLAWLGRLHRMVDWTNGCVAVTNSEMQELWRAVPDGTPIDVKP